ncbi:MAG: argininosuccinate lyase [Methylacidiphilales bacterium]|nr:argininosuccinate lyase [Candidatus Methylacidiphilales bacterium]
MSNLGSLCTPCFRKFLTNHKTEKLSMKKALLSGTTKASLRSRFANDLDSRALSFSSSLDIDKTIALHDVRASIAHATMLGACKIITLKDSKQLVQGLKQIETQMLHGEFVWESEFEDVHMLVEHRLTQLVGPVGERLHTARSRNDQTVTATRLWLRECLDFTKAELIEFAKALLDQARLEASTPMPGLTHLQFAQPVTLGHLFLAWFEMCIRDLERLQETRKRVNVMPLGSGALAGVSFPINRKMTAKQLFFSEISENSLDGVSDRDFVIEAVSVAALGMMHLSRICEDIILFSSTPFKFFEVSETFATGSSMMPQKKNPDIAELVRGKSGMVAGNWVALFTLMKAQSLTYNRDNQHDKKSLFEAFEIWNSSLSVCTPMVRLLLFNRERMLHACEQGFLNATDVADYLVTKGLPFRSAYQIAAQLVRECEFKKCTLTELPLEIYKANSELFQQDIYSRISLHGSLNARISYGGTAPVRVKEAIIRAKKRLSQIVKAK